MLDWCHVAISKGNVELESRVVVVPLVALCPVGHPFEQDQVVKAFGRFERTS